LDQLLDRLLAPPHPRRGKTALDPATRTLEILEARSEIDAIEARLIAAWAEALVLRVDLQVKSDAKAPASWAEFLAIPGKL
jgi:hypothetical protein